jgi:voltage-gated potassium channel
LLIDTPEIHFSYNIGMNALTSFFQDKFSKAIGIIIILSVLSMVMFSIESSFMPIRAYQTILYGSLLIFLLELVLRLLIEKRVTFLSAIDLVVLLNGFLIGAIDLRVLRIFRLFQIFNRSKFLLPTNTLIKTIVVQRNALFGSQIMVLSILLIVSTLIYFLENQAQPEVFSSIPAAMWWGIATLTTVGYGDVVPSTEVGKLLASLTMFLGIGMFALPAAILASAYYEEIQKKNFLISYEAIASIPLFHNLPLKAINKINEKLDVKLFQKNDTIFNKGDAADSMFIVEQGSVRVEIENPVILSSGSFFGEMALLSKSTRNATITALEDSKLLELQSSDLDELFEEHEVLFKELEQAIQDRSV